MTYRDAALHLSKDFGTSRRPTCNSTCSHIIAHDSSQCRLHCSNENAIFNQSPQSQFSPSWCGLVGILICYAGFCPNLSRRSTSMCALANPLRRRILGFYPHESGEADRVETKCDGCSYHRPTGGHRWTPTVGLETSAAT